MIKIFRKIWKYSEERHSSLLKALAASFMRSVFGITQLLSIIIAIRVVAGEAGVKQSVMAIGIMTVICITGNFVTSYIEQTNTLTTGFYMTGDRRVAAGNVLRRVPLGFFTNKSSGRITATLTTTLTGVESASAMVMIGIISGLFSSAVLFLFMLFYNLKTGIIAGAGMVCYMLVVSYQMKLSEKNAPALQEAQTGLAEAALTFLQGIRVTKAFSFRNGDRKLRDAVSASCDENIKLTTASMPSQFAAHFVIAVFESLILAVSMYMYFGTGEINMSEAVILLIFSFMVYSSLNQAGSMLSMIGLLGAGLDEAGELEETEQLVTYEPVQNPSSREIVFDDVSFSYGDNEVLHHISTKIKERSLTAIIGPSGSGKTTMCQLIPRFRDVTSGKITIGGADVRNMKYEDLMSEISMVFQNVYLFEDTIMNNIRFGKPDASEEDVIKAAKAARCHDFIMELPDGYETVISEGGGSLSGGEKQRISIARAIIKDSPVIILDEATSALDAENEHEIIAAIDELIKNKTVIMIAHRLNTVKNADHIIAIDKGCIVQEGNHESLIAEEGLYADFMNAKEEAAEWKIAN